MNLPTMLKTAERFAVANSPTIMTGLGVAGLFTTALLAGKASIKANNVIRDEEFRRVEEFTKTKPYFDDPVGQFELSGKEKFQLTWKTYIPVGLVLASSATVIIAANRVGVRRLAAVTTAYSLTERAFTEYRSKIVDKMGVKPEQAARDEIAQERISRNPPSNSEIIVTGTGDSLCFDAFSGRYFMSNIERIRRAQNDINFNVLQEMYASLTEYYELIGLPATSHSDLVGWTQDRKLDISFSASLTDEEPRRPCIFVDFVVGPMADFDQFCP